MKPLINGTQFALPGYQYRAKIDGGLRYVYGGEERCAWIGGADNPDKASWRQEFDRDRLIEWAEVQSTKLQVINVEHYPTEQLGKLAVMLEVARAANPLLKFGVWSVVPASNYFILARYAGWKDFQAGRPHDEQPASWWALVQNGPTIEAAYRGWKTENELRAKILRPHIDFTCPSIYPVVEPPADKLWMGAREPELMIAEAKRLCPDKPCYPCWCPHIPGTSTRVSDGYASAVLKAAFAKSDGVMVWADAFVSQADAATVMNQVAAFASES